MADDHLKAEQNRDEFGIDDTLNFQIVTLSNKLSLTVARRALADDGLTLREWRIMMVVFIFGPSMAREISEKALLDPAHVSRTVHAMQKAGLVAFDQNREDRRQIIVRLTEQGERIAQKVLPKAVAVSNAFRSIFSEDEYATLISLLSRANDHAEKLLGSDPMPSGGND
jgi:DNA-binding MarR family transcriptional regulator